MPHRCIYCGGAAASASLLRPAVDGTCEMRMQAVFFRAYTSCRFVTEAHHLCSTHRGFSHARTIPTGRPFDLVAFDAALRALQLIEHREQVLAYGGNHGLLLPPSSATTATTTSLFALATAASTVAFGMPEIQQQPFSSVSCVPLTATQPAAASPSSKLTLMPIPTVASSSEPSYVTDADVEMTDVSTVGHSSCASEIIVPSTGNSAAVTIAMPVVRAVSLREIPPGDNNHCFFHAVGQALGGRTFQQLRALLDRGLDKLDSVHLLVRYDLFREQQDDGGTSVRNRQMQQQPGETHEAYSLRQQSLLRRFRAAYRKRSVYRDLSMGGTPEMFLLSHALDGGLVFLVYNGFASSSGAVASSHQIDAPTPHFITSIHGLTEEEQKEIRTGRNIYAGSGNVRSTQRARLPRATFQICLLHCAYRGQGDTSNHWDLFHFYVAGGIAARPSWHEYERENDAHEQYRRSEMARITLRIQQLQEQSRQLHEFSTQRALSATTRIVSNKRIGATAAVKKQSQRQFAQGQPFPCGPTTPIEEAMESIEAQLELRLSSTALGCLGVFVVGRLKAGAELPYPSIVMTEFMQDELLRECPDLQTGVKFEFDGEQRSDARARDVLQGFTAIGLPMRKGPLINSVNTTGAPSTAQNCQLMQISDDELLAWRGFRQRRGPLPDTLVSVQLLRDVVDEELLLDYGADYWRRHPHRPVDPATVSSLSFGNAIDSGLAAARSSDDATSLGANIPCLPPLQNIPIELLQRGVAAWQRARLSTHTSVAHTQAMDQALAELSWELADHLTDGARLELPEFQRARRSESRLVSAAYSSRMEGGRLCAMMGRILQKLMETSDHELASSDH